MTSADRAQLHDSLVRQLYRRSGATGQIQLPAVPGLLDEYVTICDTLFAGVGRRFTAEELDAIDRDAVEAGINIWATSSAY